MYQSIKQFGFKDWSPQMDVYLDAYTQLGNPGFDLKHNITRPFGPAVGDFIGLFPIAYLQRALSRGKATAGSPDIAIATTTADHYILQWPHRLADGTFSRKTTGDWPGEKSSQVGSIVWGDDQTMGTVLVARMAPLFKNTDYAAEVTRQQIGFAKRLRDPKDGLNFHGYNDADGHDSCCKWSVHSIITHSRRSHWPRFLEALTGTLFVCCMQGARQRLGYARARRGAGVHAGMASRVSKRHRECASQTHFSVSAFVAVMSTSSSASYISPRTVCDGRRR